MIRNPLLAKPQVDPSKHHLHRAGVTHTGSLARWAGLEGQDLYVGVHVSPSPAAAAAYAQGPDHDLAAKAGLAKNPASETHIPPMPVAKAARRGLELRESLPASKRCCTPVGLRRASQLANRQPVSEDTMRRMLSYFQRHEVDKKGKDWGSGSKGEQAWLCWGGDEGYAWVRRVLGV